MLRSRSLVRRASVYHQAGIPRVLRCFGWAVVASFVIMSLLRGLRIAVRDVSRTHVPRSTRHGSHAGASAARTPAFAPGRFNLVATTPTRSLASAAAARPPPPGLMLPVVGGGLAASLVAGVFFLGSPRLPEEVAESKEDLKQYEDGKTVPSGGPSDAPCGGINGVVESVSRI